MDSLKDINFNDFFSALWGYEPFAWQSTLAKRVLESPEPWPEVIALPTASGKTACIDIAVFAMAVQVGRPLGQRNAPRRVFFVVDRRVIVDEAYDRACKLADRLKGAKDGIIKDVADRLRLLSGVGIPLSVHQLRGGMHRSDSWARSPTQPLIVASTVDQYGSRLLFRAYGPYAGLWPIHAGLAGNDALILLDEAHCARPFLETLQSVGKYRHWGAGCLPSPFKTVVMSATPPEGTTDVFRDSSSEGHQSGHPLGDRQLATKPVDLEVVPKAKGAKATEELAVALAKKAEELVGGRAVAAVIFANRVATARAAWRFLERRHGGSVILLTGRMRPIDKDDTVANHLTLLSAEGASNRKLERPVFVVATQTLEVGANLDFDVLVSECASLDAIRQRFGRLNRMGRPIASRDGAGRPVGARGAILVRADQEKDSKDDPVYGYSLALTWAWLSRHTNLDMGIAELEPKLPSGDALAALNAPAVHAPVMLPSHVDCWAQTFPEPRPSPDVSVFLHGPSAGPADVQVCWRLDIIVDNDTWTDILALCPPSSPECLPVPIGIMRSWLSGIGITPPDSSDVEGEAVAPLEQEQPGPRRKVIRWRGPDDPQTKVLSDPEDIRPGDTIVIPTLDDGWDVLGDLPRLPDGNPVLDWGDRAYAQSKAKAILRLNPDAMAHWPDVDSVRHLRELLQDVGMRFQEDADGLITELRSMLGAIGKDEFVPSWLRKSAMHLAHARDLGRNLVLHPNGGLILHSRWLFPDVEEDVELFSDDTDISASGTVNQSLETHLDGVGTWARIFAEGCGLEPPLVEAIELAARAHDLGKVDPRFQVWLRGGTRVMGGPLLAKSQDLPRDRRSLIRARELAGYPKGGRHELLSQRLLESARPTQYEPELLDLVWHLVESHHGRCRPFAPVIHDDAAPAIDVTWQEQQLSHRGPIGLEQIDSGVAERYWRLTRRYGWWGLAWLEAILRLADHRQSEWEELHR